MFGDRFAGGEEMDGAARGRHWASILVGELWSELSQGGLASWGLLERRGEGV